MQKLYRGEKQSFDFWVLVVLVNCGIFENSLSYLLAFSILFKAICLAFGNNQFPTTAGKYQDDYYIHKSLQCVCLLIRGFSVKLIYHKIFLLVVIMPPSDQTLIFLSGCNEKAPKSPHVPAFLLFIFASID